MSKKEEKFNKKLLVEGLNDMHVVLCLCKNHSIPEAFDVRFEGSYEQVIKSFPVELKSSGIETVGIIVDADSNLDKHWNEIKKIIKDKGFDIPDILPEEGLIQQLGRQKFGVWIMPDNNTNGMLEDFVKFLVPSDDKLMPEVKTHLNNIENKQLANYKEIHRSKAEIHSWLSAQKDPGTPMGSAITNKYLTAENETVQTFINWLKKLFS